MTSISPKQLAKFCKKFRLDNNSVLAIKEGSPMASVTAMDELIEQLKKSSLQNVLVVIVDDLDNLRVLNEAAMRKNGWFRSDAIQKLLMKSPAINVKLQPEEKNDREEEDRPV